MSYQLTTIVNRDTHNSIVSLIKLFQPRTYVKDDAKKKTQKKWNQIGGPLLEMHITHCLFSFRLPVFHSIHEVMKHFIIIMRLSVFCLRVSVCVSVSYDDSDLFTLYRSGISAY